MMKILLCSAFHPSIGGAETVAEALANLWTADGHSVTVLTQTQSNEPDDDTLPYSIVRNPSRKRLQELLRLHDIVHSNGTDLTWAVPAALAGVPFCWTHGNYALQSIHSNCWAKDKPAPCSPFASFKHHWKEYGPQSAIKGASLLYRRRFVAQYIAAANVAVTNHLAAKQPAPRQSVIYNPFDKDRFAVTDIDQAKENLSRASHTFTCMSRLIPEKGVDDLLFAFSSLMAERDMNITLKVIGDGPELENLQSLAGSLGISDSVTWTGALRGQRLIEEVHRSGICVVPSAWEEPMGVVALEFLSAGKPIIVSRLGGLAEMCGTACLTFLNRDRQRLANAMMELYVNPELQLQLISAALDRVRSFDPVVHTRRYLALFKEVLKGRHANAHVD